MRLLDFLRQYPGWALNAEGRLWSVEEYIRQFQTSARPGDIGPEVIGLPSVDLGSVTVVPLDAAGREQEPVGVLVPSSHRS
jgi:hypothetical protein